jgi:hypothetical protein
VHNVTTEEVHVTVPHNRLRIAQLCHHPACVADQGSPLHLLFRCS